MKTKYICLLILAFTIQTATAATFSFKAPEINGTIHGSAVQLTDWQAVMSCHFDHKGVRKESIRYPQTWVKKIDDQTQSLKIKKGSLSEMLPGWRLLTCAYKLILIGKNTSTQKTAFGELYFIGQEHGEMSENDLDDIKNKVWVEKVLSEKTADIHLSISVDGGIVAD